MPRHRASSTRRSSSRRPAPIRAPATRSRTSTRSRDAVPAVSQETEKEETMGVIVVGVDHSEGAKAALRFALAEAKLRQASLRVVHAWQLGYVAASFIPGSYPELGDELDELRDAAEAALEA